MKNVARVLASHSNVNATVSVRNGVGAVTLSQTQITIHCLRAVEQLTANTNIFLCIGKLNSGLVLSAVISKNDGNGNDGNDDDEEETRRVKKRRKLKKAEEIDEILEGMNSGATESDRKQVASSVRNLTNLTGASGETGVVDSVWIEHRALYGSNRTWVVAAAVKAGVACRISSLLSALGTRFEDGMITTKLVDEVELPSDQYVSTAMYLYAALNQK